MDADTKRIAWGCGCILVFVAVFVIAAVSFYESERVVAGRVVPCVGVMEDAQRDSTLAYDVSGRNLVIGIVGAETIIAPVYIVLKDFYCPLEP